MLLKRIALVTLAGIGITASGAIALTQLNRFAQADAIGNPMPTVPAHGPKGMMGLGMVTHGQITSELDYLTQMIPHHQEAIATAQIVLARSEREEMKDFARDIIEVQSAEVQQMQTWLEEWYPNQQETPSYDNMMQDLSQLEGDALDRAFLQDMIMHHMSAIHMSRMLLRQDLVEHDPVRPFAEQIASSQMQEIHQMQAWLQDWFGETGMMPGMGRMHRFGPMR
jgi:predicted outer membrane protein